jgi:Xaa-Pro aminopeptidase
MFGSGIYVPNDERWPEKFRGIGIRIEDSICVGDEDPIVLTPEAVKEVDYSLNLKPHCGLSLANVST